MEFKLKEDHFEEAEPCPGIPVTDLQTMPSHVCKATAPFDCL